MIGRCAKESGLQGDLIAHHVSHILREARVPFWLVERGELLCQRRADPPALEHHGHRPLHEPTASKRHHPRVTRTWTSRSPSLRPSWRRYGQPCRKQRQSQATPDRGDDHGIGCHPPLASRSARAGVCEPEPAYSRRPISAFSARGASATSPTTAISALVRADGVGVVCFTAVNPVTHGPPKPITFAAAESPLSAALAINARALAPRQVAGEHCRWRPSRRHRVDDDRPARVCRS
jgi:hypothetical protein